MWVTDFVSKGFVCVAFLYKYTATWHFLSLGLSSPPRPSPLALTSPSTCSTCCMHGQPQLTILHRCHWCVECITPLVTLEDVSYIWAVMDPNHFWFMDYMLLKKEKKKKKKKKHQRGRRLCHSILDWGFMLVFKKDSLDWICFSVEFIKSL